MIISAPVQTALWRPRGAGAPITEVEDQVSVRRSYRAPDELPEAGLPPQTITSFPVHRMECPVRGAGGSSRPPADHTSSSSQNPGSVRVLRASAAAPGSATV